MQTTCGACPLNTLRYWFGAVVALMVTACAPPGMIDNQNQNQNQNQNTNDNSSPVQASWQIALQGLPGGMLSVSGTSAGDVYVVGSDPGDGGGPLVLHYNGATWRKLNTGASSGLWWISDQAIGGSFWMSGDNGLILRYNPATEQFTQFPTPGSQTLYGIWGTAGDNIWAVGGDLAGGSTTGVIWHFDGNTWSAVDTSGLNPNGIPTLFKVWGRSADQVWACGADGALLFFDGTEWSALASPTPRRLFTLHGNATLIAAVGGAQSGVIIETTGAAFADVTPQSTLQMNGVFAPPVAGAAAGVQAVAVGFEGAVALRSAAGWQNIDTGLNLDLLLSYHGAWMDPEGGIWAAGGNITQLPGSDGIIVYFGTRTVGTTLVNP